MNKPLVSIVSLLYNTKIEYVKACIDSILNQTYENFEIIMIDDCSTEFDYSYLTAISPKIKLIKNEINLGCVKNVDKAFKLAAGKYIVKIDSDDYIDASLIEKEVNFLENNPQVGAVCCDLKRFGIKTQYITRPKYWNLRTALYGKAVNYGYAGGMMFRASLLENVSIDTTLLACEDFDFHLQILEYMPIQSINETLYFYRSHESNTMKTIHKNKLWKEIMTNIINKHKIKNINKKTKNKKITRYF